MGHDGVAACEKRQAIAATRAEGERRGRKIAMPARRKDHAEGECACVHLPMRHDHALDRARRAGGEADHQRRVGIARKLRARRHARGIGVPGGDHDGGGPVDLRTQAGSHQHELQIERAGDAGPLGWRRAPVDRHNRGAEPRQGKEREHVIGVVPEAEPHLVAGRDTQRAKVCRALPYAAVEVPVAQHAIPVDEGGLAGLVSRVRRDDISEVHRRSRLTTAGMSHRIRRCISGSTRTPPEPAS